MQLYIMRHGQAAPGGINDSARELTNQGQLEARLMANYLLSIQAEIDHVIVSPFIRAQQTAETVLDTLSLEVPLTSCDLITPSGIAESGHDFIDVEIADSGCKHLLIVSHMPLVSYLTAEMTVDYSAPIFQTAAIAHINYDVEKMKGELIKLTAPFDIAQ